MNLITKPSFSTSYYIRKILLQYVDELKSILAQKTGFCLNSQETLEQLLHGVYLEEILEQLLQRLYVESTNISTKVRRLETLIIQYQKTSRENPFAYQELGEIKQEIFGILGFKRVVVKIEDLAIALNHLVQFSRDYLGTILTFNHWQSTRPQFDWLDNFQINRAKITFSGIATETANATQLQWIQEWAIAFIYQVSQVIKDFGSSIQQKRIGELPGGVLLHQVSSYLAWVNNKTKVPQL